MRTTGAGDDYPRSHSTANVDCAYRPDGAVVRCRVAFALTVLDERGIGTAIFQTEGA